MRIVLSPFFCFDKRTSLGIMIFIRPDFGDKNMVTDNVTTNGTSNN